MPCPDLEQLERLASGDLDADGARSLRSHVDACDACRDVIAEVSHNLNLVSPLRRVLRGTTAPVERVGHPETIGPYRVVREIGRGGMGSVYEAEDGKLGRRIAIKVLNAADSGETGSPGRHASTSVESLTSLIEREAQLLAAINHPNIATVYSLEESEALQYLTMELIHGESLAERFRRAPLSISDGLRIARDVARALEAAHRKGVVHLDLKPQNVLITTDGYVKVLDFGLARALVDSAGAPRSGARSRSFAGTPGYMSPERIETGDVDHRADVWAFGCILYELLSGRRAFEGETMSDRIQATMTGQPDWEALPANTPAPIRLLVESCLRRDVEERLSSFSEAREYLEQVVEGVGDSPTQAVPPHRIPFPNNVPIRLSSFVGRERQIAEIDDAVRENRLVTLTGAGGCGKTRLALQVARDTAPRFPGGIWILDLTSHEEPADLAEIAQKTMGLKGTPGLSPIDSLIRRIESRAMLLVLDNCEHLVPSCRLFADRLLRSCLDLRLLLTSREPVKMPGEVVYKVPPLAFLESHGIPPPEALLASEAERLFVDRARSVSADFRITADVVPSVMSICRRLEGIPLAIELAAARTKIMPVDEIERRLDDRFRLLSRGGDSPLPQHRTLRALIDWSYDLLTDSERRLLRRLAVFRGGWTLDAMEAVCAAEGTVSSQRAPHGTTDPLNTLSDLVDKSLVELDSRRRRRSGTARYTLLETVRQYAADHARGEEDVGVLRRRHLEYFLGLAERARGHLNGPKTHVWLDVLEADHENFAAAFDASIEMKSCDGALRLAGALGRYWHLRGHWSEGLRRCEAALAMAGDGAPSPPRASTLLWLGVLLAQQGRMQDAREASEESLAVSRSIGSEQGAARALNTLGGIASAEGRLDDASRLYRESLEVDRTIGHKWGIAAGLNNLATVAGKEGRPEEAMRLLEESLAIRRELDDIHGISSSLANLGAAAFILGRRREALASFEEAHSLHEKVRDTQGCALALHNMGSVLSDLGEFERSQDCFERSLAIRRKLGEPLEVATGSLGLGDLLLKMKHPGRAKALFREGLEIFDRFARTADALAAVQRIAEAIMEEGRREAAVTLYAAALELRGAGAPGQRSAVAGAGRPHPGLQRLLESPEAAAAAEAGRRLTFSELLRLARRA